MIDDLGTRSAAPSAVPEATGVVGSRDREPLEGRKMMGLGWCKVGRKLGKEENALHLR